MNAVVSRKKRSGINILSSLLANTVITVLSFFTSKIIKEKLGLEILGINGVFSNVISILSLTEIGIGTAISFALYKPLAANDAELLKSIMAFYKKAYRIVAAVVSLLGLCVLPFVTFFTKTVNFSIAYIRLAFLLFLANTVFSYLLIYKRTIIIADQKNYVITTCTLVYTIVLKIIQLLVVILTSNYLLFLAVAVVCTACNNIFISIYADKLYPFLREKKIAKLPAGERALIFSKIRALFLHSLGTVVVFGTDNILVSCFSGVADAGRYTSYVAIINMVGTFITIIFDNMRASVGNFLVTADRTSKYALLRKMMFINHSCVYVCAVCLLSLTPTFIIFWLGSDAVLKTSVLAGLILNFILSSGNMTIGVFKGAAGFFEQDRFVPLVESVVNLVASVLLARKIGILGIIFGTTISTVIGPFWIQPFIVFKNIIHERFSAYAFVWTRDFFVFAVDFAAVCFMSRLLKFFDSNFGLFILKAVIIFSVSSAFWCLAFIKNDEFNYFVRLITGRLRHGK